MGVNIVAYLAEPQLMYLLLCHVQNVSRQVGPAQETGSAVEGRDVADLHEEDEEIGTTIQRAAEAEFTVGQTGAGGGAGGIQE